MKELIEFIVKNLVKEPEKVVVSVTEKDKETVYVVSVGEEDFGKIIGRSGKVATAIRTIAKTSAKKKNEHIYVKFERN